MKIEAEEIVIEVNAELIAKICSFPLTFEAREDAMSVNGALRQLEFDGRLFSSSDS